MTTDQDTVRALLGLLAHSTGYTWLDPDGEEVFALVRNDDVTPDDDLYPGMFTAFHCTEGLLGFLWGVDESWLAAHHDDEVPLLDLPHPLITFALSNPLSG